MNWRSVDAVFEPVEEELKIWNRADLAPFTNRVKDWVPRRDRRPTTNYNARKTHCVNGHRFTPETTYRRPKTGGRECLVCRRERRERSG